MIGEADLGRIGARPHHEAVLHAVLGAVVHEVDARPKVRVDHLVVGAQAGLPLGPGSLEIAHHGVARLPADRSDRVGSDELLLHRPLRPLAGQRVRDSIGREEHGGFTALEIEAHPRIHLPLVRDEGEGNMSYLLAAFRGGQGGDASARFHGSYRHRGGNQKSTDDRHSHD